MQKLEACLVELLADGQAELALHFGLNVFGRTHSVTFLTITD